jgi:hypothetical protein
VETWFWPRIVTAWHAAPIMATKKSGLIVELVEQDNVGYHGAFYFDVMETLLKRLNLRTRARSRSERYRHRGGRPWLHAQPKRSSR